MAARSTAAYWHGQSQSIGGIATGYAALEQGKYDDAARRFAQVLDPKKSPKFFLHWYWRMNAQLGLSNVWLASGNLRKARLEADRFLAVRLVHCRAQPARAGLGRGGTSRDGREGLEGCRGEDREGPRGCYRGSRFPRRRGAFMPPGPICTDRQRMKPPRKPTGRVPKRSSSHSRTRSRPTTRCATHSSPRHRFAGFGMSEAGIEAGGNAGFQGESISSKDYASFTGYDDGSGSSNVSSTACTTNVMVRPPPWRPDHVLFLPTIFAAAPGRRRLLGHWFGCGVNSSPLAAESVSWNVLVATP